jgi:hypothetical protein
VGRWLRATVAPGRRAARHGTSRAPQGSKSRSGARGDAEPAGRAWSGTAVPASPEALLGPEAVTKLQQALGGRGLLGRHRGGELDAPTREAVAKFQRQQGLADTGVPDRETLRKLGLDAEQAYGPRGGPEGTGGGQR